MRDKWELLNLTLTLILTEEINKHLRTRLCEIAHAQWRGCELFDTTPEVPVVSCSPMGEGRSLLSMTALCGLWPGDDDDYVLAELRDAQLVVRVELRSGVWETRLRPPVSSVPLSASAAAAAADQRRFNDDRWHKLVVSREAREVSHSVSQSLSAHQPYPSVRLTVASCRHRPTTRLGSSPFPRSWLCLNSTATNLARHATLA